MSLYDDYRDYPEPPDYCHDVSFRVEYHNGIEKETDKAILFRFNAKFGFWCPKAVIAERDDYTVTIPDNFKLKPVVLYSFNNGVFDVD